MIHSILLHKDYHTDLKQLSLAVYLLFHLLLPQGLWFLWQPLAVSDYQFLWRPHQRNLSQCVPILWIVLLGLLCGSRRKKRGGKDAWVAWFTSRLLALITPQEARHPDLPSPERLHHVNLFPTHKLLIQLLVTEHTLCNSVTGKWALPGRESGTNLISLPHITTL